MLRGVLAIVDKIGVFWLCGGLLAECYGPHGTAAQADGSVR